MNDEWESMGSLAGSFDLRSSLTVSPQCQDGSERRANSDWVTPGHFSSQLCLAIAGVMAGSEERIGTSATFFFIPPREEQRHDPSVIL